MALLGLAVKRAIKVKVKGDRRPRSFGHRFSPKSLRGDGVGIVVHEGPAVLPSVIDGARGRERWREEEKRPEWRSRAVEQVDTHALARARRSQVVRKNAEARGNRMNSGAQCSGAPCE